MLIILFKRLKEYGLIRSLKIARNRFEGLLFDLRYGVDTFTRVPIANMEIDVATGSIAHGNKCDPSPITVLAKVFQGLPITEQDVFVDFGCGKGRALFVAARFPFKRVIGVEFAADLCAVARRNIGKMVCKRPEIRRVVICEGDASTFAIEEDQTFFYWFNPFDEIIMRRVLDNICDSLAHHPRHLMLVFYHPTCSTVVDSFKQFCLTKDFELGGCHFRLYETREEVIERGR